MIRALLWKEAREQGVIVGALCVLGVSVLLALGILNAGTRDSLDARSVFTDPGILATLMLTITAGAVVGGTLFAAERETGTDVFLAMLPVRRRAVWVGKMLAGVGLVLAVTVVFFAAAAAVGLLGSTQNLGLWAVGLIALALATFAWGSVASGFARSSLAAAGLGVVLLVVATGVIVPVLAGVYFAVYPRVAGWLPSGGRMTAEVVIFSGALFSLLVLPVVLSIRLYTAPDRDRHRRAVAGGAGSKQSRVRVKGDGWFTRLTAGFRASLWMTVRQHRRMAIVLGLLGLVSGLGMLAPAAPFAALWPPVSLFLAVLVGVIGWGDEQMTGAKRFWLERRLPAGRLWWSKVIVGGAVTVAVSLVTLLPTAVKAWVMRRDFESQPSYVLSETGFPVVTFLLVWPGYGFGVGHLVGMLFRKTVVAAAVAMMVAAVAAAVWLPSIFGGGLHPWQVWVPLAVLFVVARVLTWACVADRVGTPTVLGRLALGSLAVLVAVSVSLGYRIVEIPDDPARGAETAFEKQQIPRFEDNLAGQEYRRAGALLHEAVFGAGAIQEQLTRRQVSTPAQSGRENDPLLRVPKPLATMLDSTLEHGWQPSEENERLLAMAFRTKWAESVEAAAQFPLGTVEDPRDLTLNSPLRNLHTLLTADFLLLTRGLKAQHDGDPERFVADIALVLNLSRNVRNKSVQGCAIAGRRMEQRAVQALQRWLEKLRGRDDLLVKIDRLLAEHDALCGDDSADIRLADQVVLRNTLNQSGEVLRRQWRHSDAPEDTRSRMDTEADLVGLAWQMPWEKERHDRLLARGNGVGYGYWTPNSPFRGLAGIIQTPHWQSEWFSNRGGFSMVEGLVQTDRRAARLLLAIRRFELKHGTPPGSLLDLTPEFLTELPTDPFVGRPFGYRLSSGEDIQMETRTLPPQTSALLSELGKELIVVTGGLAAADEVNVALSRSPTDTRWVKVVSVGRPVLWSTGPDRTSQGGLKAEIRYSGGDLIYLPAPQPTDRR